LEGVSERIIEKLREAGIENVERILEMGEEKLKEIPGVGEKTAVKIMEAARDLFEEVEIEVPEGMDLPTTLQPLAPSEKRSEAGATVAENLENAHEAEVAGEELPTGEDQAPASESENVQEEGAAAKSESTKGDA
jgi:DNA polymerase/3'-5' exonuclease PolX